MKPILPDPASGRVLVPTHGPFALCMSGLVACPRRGHLPVLTTPVVAVVSADGRSVRTQSGSHYRIEGPVPDWASLGLSLPGRVPA